MPAPKAKPEPITLDCHRIDLFILWGHRLAHNIEVTWNDTTKKLENTDPDITKALQAKAAQNPRILTFVDSFVDLYNDQLLLKDIRICYANLFKTLLNEKVNIADPSVKIVISEFHTLAKKLHMERRLDKSAVDKFAANLDRELYGQKPIPVMLKTAIFALIGCLFGAVVGFGAGVISTAWAGSVGALPGAALGAIKGMSIATTVGQYTLAGLATGTLGFGFFAGASARNNHQIYRNKKEIVAADIPTVIPDVNAIIKSLKPQKPPMR